jgi:predicted ArsR family transcriptional regulator
MHDTRWTVLELIRTLPQATVASLAEALDVSPITVRHHLGNLQSEGLIAIAVERKHVGRPKHVYTLTEAAQRYFPNQYHVLADRLLDTLKEMLPADQVAGIIDTVAAGVVVQYGNLPGTKANGSLEDRLNWLVAVLGQEGFMAEIKRIDGNIVLTETNCPYIYVGQRHPEVCHIDQSLIKQVMGADVEQTSCVLKGDAACVFCVKEPSA